MTDYAVLTGDIEYRVKRKKGPMTSPETNQNASEPSPTDRYSRQIRFEPIGLAGQEKLKNSQITIIGCGALGSVLAETLTRAGVGRIHLVDRDFIELSNLQRQMLFDEDDIAQNLPKAEAAARKLARINSEIEIIPFIADANHESIEIFIEGSQLILDGTDNLLARYLINDVAIKHNIPWIYGACQRATAMTATFLAGGKPCLRCLFDTPPDPGQLETCETAGIIGPVVNIIAGFQAAEALKILTDNLDAVNPALITTKSQINHKGTPRNHHLLRNIPKARNPKYIALQKMIIVFNKYWSLLVPLMQRPRNMAAGCEIVSRI